jgi:hypothetical protein
MRTITKAGSVLLLTAACGVATASPALASASRSGPESGTGLIVASATTGTRQVLYSVVHLHGVFDGTGKIVEVPNLPSDPQDVSRDNLVFPQGTIRIKSTNLTFSVKVDPATCVGTARITQTSQVTGGTRTFADATGRFHSTIDGKAVLPRASGGTCNQNAAPLVEVDLIHASGRLSF